MSVMASAPRCTRTGVVFWREDTREQVGYLPPGGENPVDLQDGRAAVLQPDGSLLAYDIHNPPPEVAGGDPHRGRARRRPRAPGGAPPAGPAHRPGGDEEPRRGLQLRPLPPGEGGLPRRRPTPTSARRAGPRTSPSGRPWPPRPGTRPTPARGAPRAGGLSGPVPPGSTTAGVCPASARTPSRSTRTTSTTWATPNKSLVISPAAGPTISSASTRAGCSARSPASRARST